MSIIFCGLCPSNDLRARDGYPLVKATCHYNIVDVYTVSDLVQEYQSKSTNPEQSISYVFPLPPSAAVCSFKAVIDGSKVIKGKVVEKRKAKEMYDAAVAQGKHAGLLEKGSVDIFRISLGNIKPSQTVSVHISFVSTISHDGENTDSLRLTVPVVIGQRYGEAPYKDMNSNKQNTFALNVSVQMNAPVTSMSSPTHPISMILGRHASEATEQFDPLKAHITLHSETFLDKDVVLIIAAQKLDHPRCNVERWLAKDGAEETTDAYTLTFVPKVDLPPIQGQEYIFLVDRSGSMSGDRIESVKNALQIMLRSLPSRKTTFNVISFGSHFTSLWNTSQVYSSDTIDKASQHVEMFQADYGGTELASALNFAYSSKAGVAGAEKPATSLFILTDGDSYDLRGVTDVVMKATKEAGEVNHFLRTFVLAVGDGVSVGMCEAIARAGDGTAVFVGSREKPDAKLVGLLRAARGGVIHNVCIEWGNKVADTKNEFEFVEKEDVKPAAPPTDNTPLSLFDPSAQGLGAGGELGPQEVEVKLAPPPAIQQAPRSDKLIFPIYPGFRCSIFAIIKPSSDTDPFASSVKIKGSVMNRPITLDIPIQKVDLANLGSQALISKPQLIHTLAARALVERWDDQPESPATKAEIVRLGKRYSIATSQTSFVAIEECNAEGKSVTEGSHDGSQMVKKSAAMDVDDYELVDGDMGYDLFSAPAPLAAPMGRPILLPGTRKMRYAYDRNIPKTLAFSDEDDLMKVSRMAAPRSVRSHAQALPRRSRAAVSSSEEEEEPKESFQSGLKKRKMKKSIKMDQDDSMSHSIAAIISRGERLDAEVPKPPPTVAIMGLTLPSIAKAQEFDGGFKGTENNMKFLLQDSGKENAPIPSTLDAVKNISAEDKATVWTTIIALAVLGKQFNSNDERSAWNLLAEKANEFVNGVLSDAGLGNAEVEELVSNLKIEAETVV